MTWIKCTELLPKVKDQIIVKLTKKVEDYTHAFIYVREESYISDLFDEWRYTDDWEKQEFGKVDCMYLNERENNHVEKGKRYEDGEC